MDDNELPVREHEEPSIPTATGIPTVKGGATEVVEFDWNGEHHAVEIRRPTWGLVKEFQRGAKTRTYREQDEEADEVRQVQERDDYKTLLQLERFFQVYVVRINGTPWTLNRPMEDIDPGWLDAFMTAAGDLLADAMGAARKKPSSP